jgi:NAD(P)-dependent dehydrogenase (short-subunit alcohol dehydrogenase family)
VIKTVVLKGDCGKTSDCQQLVRGIIKAFGGIDGIIANAGWTKFTDFADLDAMTEAEWDKCWATNVKQQHTLTKEVMPTFNKNEEGGFFIITSSVAGKSLAGSSMAYSVTKAAQLHLMKCLVKTQGSKVRMNAVLPGLLLTDWGNLYGEERIAALKDAAVLKKEVSF